ncbi:MAG: Tat pathway signal protein [Haloferacaceae archaeon]
MDQRSDRGIPRRAFLRSAVAIGGASALAACLDRERADVPTGPDDLSTLPDRQHAWNAVSATDDYGNVLPPRHRVLLALNLPADGTPSAAARETTETALRSLERAYERSHEGLLFTISYSPAYFERFDAALPDAVDLPMPEPLAAFEDPDPDTPDAMVHLASDHASVVLGAEQALRGEREELNGVAVDAALADVFEVADRRTGFVGEGLPASHQDVDGVPDSDPVPEEAPLYMGFKSGFSKNQATEDRVTIRDGPFAGGTTQHVSNLRLNLSQWYEQDDRFQRVGKMFCPAHAKSGAVEGVGDNLGDSSGMSDCPAADDSAREDGMVGHSQKMVSAREDDRPVILRRDFDSTDGGHAGLHFVALQRRVEEFVATREAMNGTDLSGAAVGERNNNGILQYLDVRTRGNFLVPPRRLRALPTASPADAPPEGTDAPA